MALSSALCASLATILIHRGLQGSSFWAGAWINVVVGAVAAWTAALILVPFDQYSWQAVPYFALSGLIGTTGGRLFRILAIQKVGAPAAAAVNNLTPLVASGLAIVLLGEHVTAPIVAGTLVIVAGTVLLSLSGRYVGFRVPHLAYPFIAASCFGIVQILRKLGLASAGPLLGATINVSAALIASTTFIAASGKLGSLRCSRRSLLYFIGGGIAENAGVFFLLLALGFGDVSVVIPLAGTAPLFVLGLTYLFP
ncbi:MAG TPA: EamA family transporter, partial [Candidatus Eisenbacteria bacterium]|nr:EamA family transporter [Candidatus Eisenbacteria bacterium]